MVLGSQSTPLAGGSGLLLCSKCNQSVLPNEREAFFCSRPGCKKSLHLKCCPGKTLKDADNARSADSLLPYFCSLCISRIKNPKRSLNDLLTTSKLDDTLDESIIKEDNAKLRDELQSAKEMIDKLLELQSVQNEKQVKQVEEISRMRMQIAAEQAEVIRISEVHARKRSRNDVSFGPEVSGFAGFPSHRILNKTITENDKTIQNKTVIPDIAPSWLTAITDEIKRLASRVNYLESKQKTTRDRSFSPRKRSKSSERTVKPIINNEVTKKTYAEIIANSKRNPNTIRLVRVNDEETRHCQEIMKSIQKDNLFIDDDITRITQKGSCNISVQCGDEVTAKKFNDAMVEKYGDAVTITLPKVNLPQVKITRIITDLTNDEEIYNQLISQNRWLSELELNLDRIYKITSYDQAEYTNIVLNTNIEGLKRMMDVGRVIFGLKTSRIYENINLFQCKRCQALGHLHKGCIKDPICRICAKSHLTENCTSTNLCCINCKNVMSKSEGKITIDVRHRASDDVCPQRKRKVTEIKKAFSKQKN